MQYDLTSDEFNNLFLSRASKKNLFSTETDREHAIVFKSELPLTSCHYFKGIVYTKRLQPLVYTKIFQRRSINKPIAITEDGSCIPSKNNEINSCVIFVIRKRNQYLGITTF